MSNIRGIPGEINVSGNIYKGVETESTTTQVNNFTKEISVNAKDDYFNEKLEETGGIYTVKTSDIKSLESTTSENKLIGGIVSWKITFSEKLASILKEGKNTIMIPSSITSRFLIKGNIVLTPKSHSDDYNDDPSETILVVYRDCIFESEQMILSPLGVGMNVSNMFDFVFYDIGESPSIENTNTAYLFVRTKNEMFDVMQMSHQNISLTNLKELYYNGETEIIVPIHGFSDTDSIQLCLMLPDEDNYLYLTFNKAVKNSGYLSTNTFFAQGTYSDGKGHSFRIPSTIQCVASLYSSGNNGIVKVNRIDKTSYKFTLTNFLRYSENGEVAGWDMLDSNANIELVFTPEMVNQLIYAAQPILARYDLSATTYLELIDALNELFDDSLTYASTSDPTIPMIFCQMIALAETAKQMMINTSTGLVGKTNLEAYANLGNCKIEVVGFIPYLPGLGGDTFVEDSTNHKYYRLSGTWSAE